VALASAAQHALSPNQAARKEPEQRRRPCTPPSGESRPQEPRDLWPAADGYCSRQLCASWWTSGTRQFRRSSRIPDFEPRSACVVSCGATARAARPLAGRHACEFGRARIGNAVGREHCRRIKLRQGASRRESSRVCLSRTRGRALGASSSRGQPLSPNQVFGARPRRTSKAVSAHDEPPRFASPPQRTALPSLRPDSPLTGDPSALADRGTALVRPALPKEPARPVHHSVRSPTQPGSSTARHAKTACLRRLPGPAHARSANFPIPATDTASRLPCIDSVQR
jgi:hypothetical protein